MNVPGPIDEFIRILPSLGVIGTMIYYQGSKVLLGALLTILAVIYPRPTDEGKMEDGEGKLLAPGVELSFKGGGRIILGATGLMLVVLSAIQSTDDRNNEISQEAQIQLLQQEILLLKSSKESEEIEYSREKTEVVESLADLARPILLPIDQQKTHTKSLKQDN